MKAIICTRYGPPEVLQLKEVVKPAPSDNEILIKIHATTVTAGDCEMRGLKFPPLLKLLMRAGFGFRGPRNQILGTELSGEVESVGKDVKLFSAGHQVFGSTGAGLGANAEYVCLPEKPRNLEGGVVAKPANMTYEEAATVPFGGRDALHFLRKGNIKTGQKILINGAGGSIGTFAIQLAKHFGAEVTAVDSTDKLDMLRSIGADHVVDYTQEDFTENGEIYDVIFDVVGKISFSRSAGSIKPRGTYLLANPTTQMFSGLWTKTTSNKKVVMDTANGTTEDLIFLRELVETEKIRTIIDRTYPLEQIAEAHRYVETGRKQGNVVITVGHSDN